MKREQAYANQINEGDRIEVLVTVDRTEIHGEQVTLHVSGQLKLAADEQVWRQS